MILYQSLYSAIIKQSSPGHGLEDLDSSGINVFDNGPIVCKLCDWENSDDPFQFSFHTFKGFLVCQFTTVV